MQMWFVGDGPISTSNTKTHLLVNEKREMLGWLNTSLKCT